MAAVSQRGSGIPQPVAKARGPSRLASMQSQFQQREAADRQKKLAELAPVRPAAAAPVPEVVRSAPTRQPAAAVRGPARTAAAAQASAPGAATRGPVSSGAAAVRGVSGGGRVRAMFQSRRAGPQQTSPIGWDRSYPLEPIKKSAAPATSVTSRQNGAPSNTHKPTAPVRAHRPEAAAAPAPARRPAAAAEPRRPAPPKTAARAPPKAAKENQPPAPRPPPADPNLAQCPICSRAFARDRLDKHKTICEKSAKKKRKVFDPVKMRVQGTESESYLRKQKVKKAEQPAPAKKDWRRQHEEFIRNIRAAKKAQAILAAGGSIKDLPPPPPMDTSDYVQCPHCSRKFSEAAADRHIPKCANISSNKPASGRAPAGRGAARTRR